MILLSDFLAWLLALIRLLPGQAALVDRHQSAGLLACRPGSWPAGMLLVPGSWLVLAWYTPGLPGRLLAGAWSPDRAPGLAVGWLLILALLAGWTSTMISGASRLASGLALAAWHGRLSIYTLRANRARQLNLHGLAFVVQFSWTLYWFSTFKGKSDMKRLQTSDHASGRNGHYSGTCKKAYGRQICRARAILSSYPSIRNGSQQADHLLILAADFDQLGGR